MAPSREAVEEAGDGGTRSLFSASTVIEDEWQQLRFLGTTQYRVALYRGRLAISARARTEVVDVGEGARNRRHQ